MAHVDKIRDKDKLHREQREIELLMRITLVD